MNSVIKPSRLAEIEFNRIDRMKARAQHLHTSKVRKAIAEGKARNFLLKVRTLDDRKLKAISMLCDFSRNYPVEYVAAQCGVNTSRIYRWRNDPLFISRMDTEITKRRNYMRLEAFKHLFRKVKMGNFKVIREYLKMTGDLKENLDLKLGGDTSRMSDKKLARELKALEAELGVSVE